MDEFELGVTRDEAAGSVILLRGDHATGMKFVNVWNEIRAERGEDMIEEKEEEDDDPAGTADAEREEREISRSGTGYSRIVTGVRGLW
jgi:hypothetical protein